MDQAIECDEKGDSLKLTDAEMEDNQDELIRLMHKAFLDGHDVGWVDYQQIDNDDTLDDFKQID